MFQFRPAKRQNVGLLIGLVGSSGSGKTFSSMRLAKGLAGGSRFAVIDTEAGRATHYADRFEFDHGDLKPPFEPAAYADAIQAADAAGYPVIVVDSCSHEHSGDGGILDMQEAELARMAGNDWQKREAVKMAAWVRPKGEHKKMVQRLLQVRAHLILCFRAEEKIEMVRENGKTIIRPKASVNGASGWIPICEKTLPYELTTSLLLTPDAPGMPKPIKLQDQHRTFFPLDKPISEESGARLAEWARGGAAGTTVKSGPGEPSRESGHGSGRETAAPPPPESAASSRPAQPGEDPRAALIRAIAAEKAKLERQPSDEQWTKLCRSLCAGAEDLAVVDQALLDEFLALMRLVVAKDRAAVDRVRDILAK